MILVQITGMGDYDDTVIIEFIFNLSILIGLNDEYDGLVSMIHHLPHLPQMGVAPISPLVGALP